MESSSKLPALLLLLMLSISSSFHIATACDACSTPKHPKKRPTHQPPGILPPIIGKPPTILPPIIVKPPTVLPPIIVKPPTLLPPIVVKPPTLLPPLNPPITLPPGLPLIPAPPETGTPGCTPPPAPVATTCPIDTVKLGAYLDLIGNVVHIGDPEVNKFCPIIEGLTGLEAALCLCTTIKIKLLNLNVVLPIALELLVTCGKTVPPGYTCP